MKIRKIDHRPAEDKRSIDGRQRSAEDERCFADTGADDPCEVLHRIAGAIRQLPDLDPPGILLPSVMKCIRSKKMPLWHRVYRWAKSPRTITFTPLQLASVAALMICFCTLLLAQIVKGDNPLFFQASHKDNLPIVLSLNMPDIHSAAVIGTFNDWHAQGYEMQMSKEKGAWTMTLWLPAGRYEYAFMVDGCKIIPDPRAGFYQDDGFGNQNAVLVVVNNDEKAI